MATYVWKCDNPSCGEEFTIRENMSDHSLTAKYICQMCEANEQQGMLVQVLYPVAIKFNGPGFFVNDYKSNKINLTKDSE